MTLIPYKPIRRRYVEYAIEYSPVTDQLIKRKRIMLFTGATAQEWLELANDFLSNNGRANFTFCMTEYKKQGGQIETPKPTLPQLPAERYDWQKWTGDD